VKRVTLVSSLLPLLLLACIKITTVDQPSSVVAGSEITIRIYLQTDLGEETEAEGLSIINAHGLLGICAPSDWELLSAEFKGDVVGKMSEDSAFASDCQDNLPADLGYRWVGLVSQKSFEYTEEITDFEVVLKFKVGENKGDYLLTYRSGLSYGTGSETTTAWHSHIEKLGVTVN